MWKESLWNHDHSWWADVEKKRDFSSHHIFFVFSSQKLETPKHLTLKNLTKKKKQKTPHTFSQVYKSSYLGLENI